MKLQRRGWLELEREKLGLEKWKALAKAAGWVLDRFYFEEEEE